MRSAWQTGIALSLIGLANLPGLKMVFSAAPLRLDTDTVVMLNAMREAGGLAGFGRWFTGDWFLQNHFYRPTTCLSLLVDYALYRETAWGYSLTNWLLSLLTGVGVYFLFRRFASSPPFAPALPCPWSPSLLAVLVALAFSLQQNGAMDRLGPLSAWWLIAICLLIALLPRLPFSSAVPRLHPLPSLARSFYPSEPPPSPPPALSTFQRFLPLFLGIGMMLWGWDRLSGFSFTRLVTWVPSRTALLMACCGVWSLYAFLRWGDTGRARFLLLASLLLATAFGAYEQAITLVLLITLLAWFQQGIASRQRWGMVLAGWGIAFLYLLLRFTLVPVEPSDYQKQQLRGSLSVWGWMFAGEIVPVVSDYFYWFGGAWSPYNFLFKEPWDHLVMDIGFAGVLWAYWRRRRWFGWWLAWHTLTYLPMSVLHPFEHYLYLPQIGKNGIDISLLVIGSHLLITGFQDGSRLSLSEGKR